MGFLFLSFLCPFFVLLLSFLSFLDFSWLFPIGPGIVWGFSRIFPFLFLGLLTAPARNSPERVGKKIRTFPEKIRKPPGLETPRFSFSQRISRLQQRPAERGHVKERQKSSKSVKHFSTIFDIFRAGQKTVKNRQIKKCQNIFFDTFRQFSRGTSSPAPFGGALKEGNLVVWMLQKCLTGQFGLSYGHQGVQA